MKLCGCFEKSYPHVKEIHYILITGANWKGTIKSFCLEITAPDTTTIVLTDIRVLLKKINETQHVLNLTNFTPK